MLLNFELGVVPATENYFELFKKSHFTDVPTLIGDLKAFFSFQIEHLTLKFTCTLKKIKMLQYCHNGNTILLPERPTRKNAVCC